MKRIVHEDAAWVVAKVSGHVAGLKTAVFRDLPVVHRERSQNVSAAHLRRVYALACESLRFASVLERVLRTQNDLIPLLKDSASRAMLLVLAYDALVSEKPIPSGEVASALSSCLPGLRTKLDEFVSAAPSSGSSRSNATQLEKVRSLLPSWSIQQESVQANQPRYVRVNHIRTNLDDLVAEFQSEGWRLTDSVMVPTDGCFHIDPLIKDLLVFPPATDFHAHAAIKDGRAVLQDKASCMPAFALLGDGWRPDNKASEFIDCCAAPGNKTSQLASLLCLSGRKLPITAFERDPKRATLLQKRLLQYGASRGSSDFGSVTVKQCDFLTTDPVRDTRWRNVRAVLVDPSCSGSGLGHRVDHAKDDDDENACDSDGGVVDKMERVKALASFQKRILRHALKFPRIERVVYSTCSIHKEENEEVVAAVLPFVKKRGMSLVECLPAWQGRGQACDELSASLAKRCVRCGGDSNPGDTTHGFFVALFAKDHTPPSDEQKSSSFEKAASVRAGSKPEFTKPKRTAPWKLAAPKKKRSR